MYQDFLGGDIIFRLIVLFIFGMMFGSFFNVVIYRLPIMLNRKWKADCAEYFTDECNSDNNDTTEKFNLSYPSSHCVNCKSSIPWWSNIPLFGYLFLRGKCLNCKQHISLRYPIIEVITGLLFVLCGYLTSNIYILSTYLVFVSFMLCISLIDYDTFLLPDELSLPLLWLGLFINLNGLLTTSLFDSVVGAMCGYLMLWIPFWVFKLITKKDGMGYGDFKFLAAIGAWGGWQILIVVILISSFSGIIYALILRLCGKFAQGNHIPFGPFLAVGGLVGLFWGRSILKLWIG